MLYNGFIIAPTSPTWGAFPIEHPDGEQLNVINEIMKQYIMPADYTLTDWSNFYGLTNYVIMQYITLKDKDNKDIYEDDIAIRDNDHRYYVVSFSPTMGFHPFHLDAFMSDERGRNVAINWYPVEGGTIASIWKVVGNRHENLDLIK